MSSLEEIKTEFIRLYEDIFIRRGLTPIFGRIVAVFLLEGRDLSQQEISDLTGYSISSVSRALDQMIQMGALKKHKDTRFLRQFVYRMNLDLRNMVADSLEVVVRNTTVSIEEVKKLIRKMDALKHEGEEKAEINRIKTILKDNEEYLESLVEILKDVLKKMHAS